MYDDKPRWIVQELVTVKYPEGDLVGMFFGYYSLLVYTIAPVYVTLFLVNRDLLTSYLCFAHLISEVMTSFLKRLLKIPRPQNSAPTGGLLEGKYGMPSQHCHCFAFIYFTSIWLMFHYYSHCLSRPKKLLILFIMTVATAIQFVGRMYLNFHTFNQCLCGILFGAFTASLFYYIGIRYIVTCKALCNMWPLRILGFRCDLLGREFYSKSYSEKLK